MTWTYDQRKELDKRIDAWHESGFGTLHKAKVGSPLSVDNEPATVGICH